MSTTTKRRTILLLIAAAFLIATAVSLHKFNSPHDNDQYHFCRVNGHEVYTANPCHQL